VIRTAHELGIRTTSTMMFGHVETPADRLRHMELLRDLQRETGGFTEFVPLSFVHAEAPLFVEHGPGGLDVVRTHALARVMLGHDIPNLQVSWVKEGLRVAEHLLACGANDLGGTLINESISTAAGAAHGQLATPAQLRRVARGAGRVPAERSTLYRVLRVLDREPGDAGDPLDRVDDADARFGSYRALVADPRVRFRRPGREQVGEVRGTVEVETEAVAIDRDDPHRAGARGDDVAAVAVGVAELGGQRGGQVQAEGVGAEVITIRRRDQVRVP
jgi:hypothetical protein